MTSSNQRGILTVIYDPETGLLFSPDNDVLVCDVPINGFETDTEQIEYIQTNGIPLNDVVRRGMAAYRVAHTDNLWFDVLTTFEPKAYRL